MKRSLIALLLLAAAGCGGGDRQGAIGGAPLLTPGEAEGRNGLVAIQGFLWARPADGDFRLCETALESFPPQCGEPAIVLGGVDVTQIAGIDFSQNVFWADGVRARGELTDDTLAVEAIELNSTDEASGLRFRMLVPIEVAAGPVDFVALVTNGSPEPAGLRFTNGQSADVVLRDTETGATVYSWSAGRGFDEAIRDLTVEPGETLRFVLDEAALPLEPGVYDLAGELTGSPAPPAVLGRLVVR
jgi:hypothetical protein